MYKRYWIALALFATTTHLPGQQSTSNAGSARETQTVGGVPVLGRLSGSKAAAQLLGIGDTAAAFMVGQAALSQPAGIAFEQLALGGDKPYRYTAHAFGYIAPGPTPTSGLISIQNAETISPDNTLRNSELKITLDRLRVYEYPGRGVHQILFDFYAQHQAGNAQPEDLHFSQTYRVLQGSSAGITGYPVFLGLRPGAEGVSFRVSTINVSNEDDQKILGFMDSDVFKNGLRLVNSVNPVLPVVTKFAEGLTETLARRNNNVPVQSFQMGLDFSTTPTRARLRQGSYVAVQIPDLAMWNWGDWALNTQNGALVRKASPTTAIPYNYIVFSVSKM